MLRLCPSSSRAAIQTAPGLVFLIAFAAFLWMPSVFAETYRLPLFVAETDDRQVGVLRLNNDSTSAGSVSIHAIDDSGSKSGPATLMIGASATVELDASELASGNTAKGLSGGLGTFQGHVRLEIMTDLDLDVLAYLRAQSGTLTVLHDEVRPESGTREAHQYDVPIFHSSSNSSQAQSSLRLINPGPSPASITIGGRDVGAANGGDAVSLMLAAGNARTLTAAQLERGGVDGLTGQLGSAAGGWRLSVSSDQPIEVVNLVTSQGGRLANLSSSGRQGLAPADHGLFNERFVDTTLSTRRGSTQTAIRILEGEQFEESQDSTSDDNSMDSSGTTNSDAATRSGDYSYRRTSEDAGELVLNYSQDDPCAMNLHFTSRQGGWYATRCESGEVSEGVWHGGSWFTDDTDRPGTGSLRFPAGAQQRDLSLSIGTAITTLRLPAAVGGSGTLVYSLNPDVPGLVYDRALRQLSGTPSTAGMYEMTYTVEDSSGNSGMLAFRITVSGGESGECTVGLVLRAGESCVYPGTTETFSVSADGSEASFLVITSVRGINLANRTYLGQVYDIRVVHDGNGVWRIVRLLGEEQAEPDTEPMFGLTELIGPTYRVGEPADALTLPAATEGNGQLAYTLTPAVPGLTFSPPSRQLTGTPAQAGNYPVTYEVTDEDGDTASLSFTIFVRNINEPDLVAGTPTASDASLTPGQSFTLSARIRNDGDTDVAAAIVRLYRSADMTLSTADDSQVGSENLGTIEAGGSETVSLATTASAQAGEYYYFVCLDEVARESNSDNNCSASVRVTVAEPSGAPDLVVASLTSSATSVVASATFRLTATFRNQGDAQSPSTRVLYMRSSDTTITASDTQVSLDTLEALAPSGQAVEFDSVRAPASAGTYYFGACVEAVEGEANTGNNCSSAVRVTVTRPPTTPRPDPTPTEGPDLRVESARVNDSRPDAGATFELSVRVSNRGNQPSGTTTVRFYRSADSRIDTSDTELGATQAQDGLARSGTSELTESLTAPSTPGTFYYGACVAPVVNELNVTNNCSNGARIVVQVDGPNLYVTSSASNTQPRAGQGFRLSATVRNIGNEAAPTTTLTFRSASDPDISNGQQIGDPQDINALGASRSSSKSVTVTAPEEVGTSYYGACVAGVSGDTDSTNDCSVGVKVTVPGSDLVVQSVEVDDSSPEVGDSFKLTATIRNSGISEAPSTTLTYYRSTDNRIATDDTSEGTDNVKSLDPRESEEESITITAQTSAGVYYYGACIATVAGEGDATNNCSSAVLVTVGAPDLVVQSPTLDDRTPEAGDNFRLSVRVRNIGHVESPSTTLEFYQSADAEVSTDDTKLDETASVSTLEINEYSSETGRLTAPDTPGDYYFYACIPDSVAAESNTDNNCSTPVKITVPAPDLTVDRPRADDTTPDAGDRFTLTVRVLNRGPGTAGGTTLQYYQSDDNQIDTSDTEIGTDSVASLSPSESDEENTSVTAPSTPGTYYYGACAVALDIESNMDNNCSTALRITVPAPDLVVISARVDDSTLQVGDDFEFSATVRNRGGGTASATTLRYYQATMSDFSDEAEVGTADAVSSLDAGESSAERIDLTAPSTAGTYYYRACVVAPEHESNTENNCSSRVTVTVRNP